LQHSTDIAGDAKLVRFWEQIPHAAQEQGIVVSRVLTDRGTEYCGNPQSHQYEPYLAVENIDHTRTKARGRQTNGICERFNKTILVEFYQVALRKKIYRSIEALQMDLDVWMRDYNTSGPIRVVVLMARPRCRPSLTHCRWPRRNCCRQREQRHQVFAGHPPRHSPNRQIKSILLQRWTNSG
jgi:hypothetical protein